MFLGYKSSAENVPPQTYSGVLRLWHIDSFEGGKGARSTYLNKIARVYERANKGVFVLITVHTRESAAYAVSQGDVPDLLSFGTYDSFAADLLQPLSGSGFDAGQLNGTPYAFPWCRGGYMLFTVDGDFTDVSSDNTVLSKGRNALPELAFCASGWKGKFAVQDSLRAYINFLNGEFKYMVGTQRDVFRLKTREVNFQTMPLAGANDLYQYIGICIQTSDKYVACREFVDLLLAEEAQRELSSIGMMSVYLTDVYDSSDEALSAAEKAVFEHNVKAFLSEEAIADLQNIALQVLEENADSKNLQNFFA